METKTCDACGCTFTPRPQHPNQAFCTNPDCQRERRRLWQQKRRREDADYRDNEVRSGKGWASKNPGYWKQYRDEHPDYAQRNRNLQHERNKRLRTPVIANEDVSRRQSPPPAGRYRMVQITDDGRSGDTWIVEIIVLSAPPTGEDV